MRWHSHPYRAVVDGRDVKFACCTDGRHLEQSEGAASDQSNASGAVADSTVAHDDAPLRALRQSAAWACVDREAVGDQTALDRHQARPALPAAVVLRAALITMRRATTLARRP